MKDDKDKYLDNWVALGRRIFLQACKDLMGMDGASPKHKADAERWLLSPAADFFAGMPGAGAKAVRMIYEDPIHTRKRFLAMLNTINAETENNL